MKHDATSTIPLLHARFAVCVLVLAWLITSLSPAFGACPLAHFWIARRAAEKLAARSDAPEFVRDIDKNKEYLSAFCTGAISPDLASVNHMSHYGKTSELPLKMIAKAKAQLKAVLALPRTQNDAPALYRQARLDLAFAYGWLSHIATDCAVHPIVNAAVGDSYPYCSALGVTNHASEEVGLDRFVSEVFKEKVGLKLSWRWDLMAGCSGKSAAALVADADSLVKRAFGASLWESVKWTDGLKEKWEPVVARSIGDTVELVCHPERLRDWDLDAGNGITTDEFKNLRETALDLNDGKLPSNWGVRYTAWCEQTRRLTGKEYRTKLAKLMGIELDSSNTFLVKLSDSLKGRIRILANGNELAEGNDLRIPIGEARTIIFTAIVRDDLRSAFEGSSPSPISGAEGATILARTPYKFEIAVGSGQYKGGGRWTVTSEEYEWAGDWNVSQKRAFSSGVNPNVHNDQFEWIAPEDPKHEFGASSNTCRIAVTGKISWKIERKDGIRFTDPWSPGAALILVTVPDTQ